MYRRSTLLKRARVDAHKAWRARIKALTSGASKGQLPALDGAVVATLLRQFLFFSTTATREQYATEWKLTLKLLTSSCNSKQPQRNLLATALADETKEAVVPHSSFPRLCSSSHAPCGLPLNPVASEDTSLECLWVCTSLMYQNIPCALCVRRVRWRPPVCGWPN